jgi:hypothetical protein
VLYAKRTKCDLRRNVALFRQKSTVCPICQEGLPKNEIKGHWIEHVKKIENGEHAGAYTWICSCGPATMWWPKDYGAEAGLALHMAERHRIGF